MRRVIQCELLQPGPEALARAVKRTEAPDLTVPLPPGGTNLWGRDNSDLVIGRLLPLVRDRLSPLTLRFTVEAYLTQVSPRDWSVDGPPVPFEVAISDGSTVVPDTLRPFGCRIKDIYAMPHDLAYVLHRQGLPSVAFGRRVGLWEAHAMYREIAIAFGKVGLGWIRWAGLAAVGWTLWREEKKK